MSEILTIGPPIYWVIGPGLNYSDPEEQNFICGGINCNIDSLSTKLYIAARYPEMYVSQKWLLQVVRRNYPLCVFQHSHGTSRIILDR